MCGCAAGEAALRPTNGVCDQREMDLFFGARQICHAPTTLNHRPSTPAAGQRWHHGATSPWTTLAVQCPSSRWVSGWWHNSVLEFVRMPHAAFTKFTTRRPRARLAHSGCVDTRSAIAGAGAIEQPLSGCVHRTRDRQLQLRKLIHSTQPA